MRAQCGCVLLDQRPLQVTLKTVLALWQGALRREVPRFVAEHARAVRAQYNASRDRLQVLPSSLEHAVRWLQSLDSLTLERPEREELEAAHSRSIALHDMLAEPEVDLRMPAAFKQALASMLEEREHFDEAVTEAERLRWNIVSCPSKLDWVPNDAPLPLTTQRDCVRGVSVSHRRASSVPP